MRAREDGDTLFSVYKPFLCQGGEITSLLPFHVSLRHNISRSSHPLTPWPSLLHLFTEPQQGNPPGTISDSHCSIAWITVRTTPYQRTTRCKSRVECARCDGRMLKPTWVGPRLNMPRNCTIWRANWTSYVETRLPGRENFGFGEASFPSLTRNMPR